VTQHPTLPAWAADIQREIPNWLISQRLISELKKVTEMLRLVVVEYKSEAHSNQSTAAARDELKRLRRQAEKLRDSLQTIGTKPKTMVARQLAELFMEDNRKIREELRTVLFEIHHQPSSSQLRYPRHQRYGSPG